MNKERVGALIDAVYAIAMTILVLELPIPESIEEIGLYISKIVVAVLDYGLAFVLLFAFWYNQRRINDLVEKHTRITLWLNGLALMMIALMPFAAHLLYRFGDFTYLFKHSRNDVFIDAFFVGVCLTADLLINSSLWLTYRTRCYIAENRKLILEISRSRQIAVVVSIVVMALSILLPGSDRRSLIVLPLVLIFEEELLKTWDFIRQHMPSSN
ncbi:MAG: TMEM175 family protein [Cyanobacteria bacterium J06642_2]